MTTVTAKPPRAGPKASTNLSRSPRAVTVASCSAWSTVTNKREARGSVRVHQPLGHGDQPTAGKPLKALVLREPAPAHRHEAINEAVQGLGAGLERLDHGPAAWLYR